MSSASIIIPAYNAGAYIAEAVGSALGQTYGEKELIVVDDGSSDNTREVIAPYVRNGHVKYFSQDNSGPSAARNAGLSHANGHVITFLDADDILAPEYLESVGAFLDEYPGVDFVFTNYEVFDNKGVSYGSGVNRWKMFREIPHTGAGEGRRLFCGSLTKYIIAHGGFMTTSCVAVRKR
ncbi:MAG TPA: glycosyltransferase family A protein, partial [Dissulfurispiraceae bacterium]